MDTIEPVVIASLATGTPMLLIGPHGTAKSLLLCRLCEALGIIWRHYNASLLNYDDLVGYPLPDDHGGLRFVQTPASIWEAQAVFLDEISRCRPDMQNRLFSIIHEKRVQGMPIEKLIHRWAAMNPPVTEDCGAGGCGAAASGASGVGGAGLADTTAYLGSEPLDSALADRFNFVVEVPRWMALSHTDREAIISSTDAPVTAAAATALRDHLELVRAEITLVEAALAPAVAEYVRLISDHTLTLGLALSGRRAAMLFRNVIAVHAAQLIERPATDASDSAWLALEHSLPHRAEGARIDRARLLLAHNSAWAALNMSKTDPRRMLVGESCPVRRAIRATALACLSPTELSAYIADGLAEVAAGGRHALAAFVVNSPAACRLNAALAEQAAELYAVTVVAQDVKKTVRSDSPARVAWQEIVTLLAALDPADPESIAITNLLVGLFASGVIAKSEDIGAVLDSWRRMRLLCHAPIEVNASHTQQERAA